MAGFNRVILMGNLTRDPEVRHVPSGTPVAELRLAVSEVYRNRNTNERSETTCFVDVVFWDRQAELCGEYLKKGAPVLVEGRLKLDEWKNPQGEPRSKLLVRGDRIQFLGQPKRGEYKDGDPPEAAGGGRETEADAANREDSGANADSFGNTTADGEAPAGDDDDLPF